MKYKCEVMERLHCKENWCRLGKGRSGRGAGEPAVGGAGEAVSEQKSPCAAEKCFLLRVLSIEIFPVMWSSVRMPPWIRGTTVMRSQRVLRLMALPLSWSLEKTC